ncbi:MAG: tetratricopeptide repeat protein, partial [Anaerolineales bacterium]|nr:tetratricopeptide repeat protein [Anaerolineales bacterium]
AELAYRLGLARRSVTDQAALHELVLNWLHTTNQRWLLVYDNADAIQPNELRPFLPRLGHGACLITSRNPNWGGLAQTLNLTHFSQVEAVAFLLGQPTMTEDGTAAPLKEAHPQGEAALKLAALLGHLPLALEHARAYVEETGCTLADYASYFENERDELWADVPAPANYDEKTITTTWELAFAQAKQTPGAAALLNLCCFLAPDEIPLNLLMAAVGAMDDEHLPEELVALAKSKLKLDKAIAALRRYSLLTRDGDTIALHRLVQTVARDQMPPEMRQRWAEVAVDLLLQAWPYDYHDLTTWERGGDFLPHLLAAAAEAENVDLLPEQTGLLLNQVGFFLHHRADYSLALNLYQRALEIDEKAYGSEHAAVAVRLSNLGQLLQDVGEYEAARPYLERALAIDEKALGPEHPNMAIRLNNLGHLLQDVGEYEAARSYLERALTLLEKNLGEDHPNVATLNNNFGQLLQAVGEYRVAQPYLERALAIFEKNLGEDHPIVATLISNLGQLFYNLGEYKVARAYLERALIISEKALGPDHPDVAIKLNNLGQLLQAMREYEVARTYLKSAQDIFEVKLGWDHPKSRIARINLAALLQEMEGKS